MPELRNLIEYETVRGFRSFELWQGDITDPGFPVHVLVISAFAGDYTPTSTSVIGALLNRHGVSVQALADDCEYDLLKVLGVWISRPILAKEVPFERILCVEFFGSHQQSWREVIDNTFCGLALLEAKGIDVKTVALPMIGTGNIGLEPRYVMKNLLPAAKRAIERSASMEKVCFFAYEAESAHLLDQTMNKVLGRESVVLSKAPLVKDLRAHVVQELRLSRHLVDERFTSLLEELDSVLRREDVRSFEIGILGRRLAEMIVTDLHCGNVPTRVLANNIQALDKLGVAGWIIGYLQVLRHLGNESAHENHSQERTPAFINEGDMAMCLFCIQRLWDFWVEWKKR